MKFTRSANDTVTPAERPAGIVSDFSRLNSTGQVGDAAKSTSISVSSRLEKTRVISSPSMSRFTGSVQSTLNHSSLFASSSNPFCSHAFQSNTVALEHAFAPTFWFFMLNAIV